MYKKSLIFLLAVTLLIGSIGCRGGDSSGANLNDDEIPYWAVAHDFVAVPGNQSLTLSWSAAIDNIGVSGYWITMTDPAPEFTVAVGAVGSFIWDSTTATELTNGMSYEFSLVAFDAVGNVSVDVVTANGIPEPPDTESPTDVSGLDGVGRWHNALLEDYAELSLWWSASSSADVSYYELSISSDGGTTWNVLYDTINDTGVNVGIPSDPIQLIVPNDFGIPAGPVYSSDMLNAVPYFTMGATYTVRVVVVDTSDNRSVGVTAEVIPTESQDITAPEAIRNLQADPGNGLIALSWQEPIPIGDAVSYEVYYRSPADDDITPWISWGNTGSLDVVITGLLNGVIYEFMVCAVDGLDNEHAGADTSERDNDTADNKITAIPTSNSITCTANIQGGAFRYAYFKGKQIVLMVASTQNGILSTDNNTNIYYTLDGSEIDVNLAVRTKTQGFFSFDDTINPEVVTEITPGYLYAVTIDFQPELTFDYTNSADVEGISDNTLRPNGKADHIILKYQIKTATDASRVFSETYLIYPTDDIWTPEDDIWIDVDNDGFYSAGDTQVYDIAQWHSDISQNIPGSSTLIRFDNLDGNDSWDGGEDIWVDNVVNNYAYDEESQVYDNDGVWDVAGGTSGMTGLIVYDNITVNSNNYYDTGEDIWVDDVLANLAYDIELEVYSFDGTWAPTAGTSGITGLLVYHNVDGNNQYDRSEDVWLDDIVANQLYDAGETIIYDGIDALVAGDAGSNVDIYFYDSNDNGVYDVVTEDIWSDNAVANSRYNVETVVLDLDSSLDNSEAAHGTAGSNIGIVFDNSDANNRWDSGDDIWRDDIIVNSIFDQEIQVYDNGDGWDISNTDPGADGSLVGQPMLYLNTLEKRYLKFSGMVEHRKRYTSTYVESGSTAGDIICIGGYSSGNGYVGSAERYRTWFEHYERLIPTVNSDVMVYARGDHCANLLTDGSTILITGGYDSLNKARPDDFSANRTVGLKTYERFYTDASSEGFNGSGELQAARRFHQATQLYDGRILVTGGLNGELAYINGGYGSVAAPHRNLNLDPSLTTLSISFVTDVVGAIVEVLMDGQVVQTAVITSYEFNDLYGWYDMSVSGLVSDALFGDSYRIINAATAEAEDFTATGLPGGIVTSSTEYERYGHSATLLQDGTVFIAGGLYDYDQETDDRFEYYSELFNPISNTFSTLGILAELKTTRFFHNAILLRDGKVLISGGLSKGDHAFVSSGFKGASITSSASIYDPYTHSIESVGSMTKPRFMHTATLLSSGKVMICGGYFSVTPEGILIIDNSAEIYNPVTQSFSTTGNMLTQRGTCTATLIEKDDSPLFGQVLVGGGAHSTLAEVYDESTGRFYATAHGVTSDRFIGSTSTVLNDGRVLITGGQTDDLYNGSNLVAGNFLSTAELYNSSSVKFESTGGNMSVGRRHHMASLLQDGRVLITGGENDNGGLSGAELFDPSSGGFVSVPEMLNPRYKHTATVLMDGNVLIVGGANEIGSLSSCEMYDSAAEVFTSVESMQVGRFDHTATLLPNGWVLITGGEGIDDRSVEIFDPSIGEFLTALNEDQLVFGRSGHSAVQPAYTIGRARFENCSTTVIGSTASDFGLENTAWDGGHVRAGDMLMSIADNVVYIVDSVTNANALELTVVYAGISTDMKLTGAAAASEGFEAYIILSQDVYITGGEVVDTTTEIFDFDADIIPNEWPGVNPTDYRFLPASSINNGRYGFTLTPLADMGLLLTGGLFMTDGEYMTPVWDGTDYYDLTNDTWTISNLDSWEWKYHTSFRVSNKMVVVVSGHSAQIFFAE